MRALSISAHLLIGLLLSFPMMMHAEQFVLFDETLTFPLTEPGVDRAQHHYVIRERLNPKRPTDWTGPIDYSRGTAHIRVEVIEKPPGDVVTRCGVGYFLNRPQTVGEYATLYSQAYVRPGIYESETSTGAFPFDDVAWSKGLKEVKVEILTAFAKNAARSENPEKYFPTKVRVTVVHVSAGSEYNPNLVPPQQPVPAKK